MSHEINTMPWQEFTMLLSGLSGETPLGHIIQIRTETDKEFLKHLTPSQRKIRAEWNRKKGEKAKVTVSQDELNAFLDQMKAFFMGMADTPHNTNTCPTDMKEPEGHGKEVITDAK